MKPTIKRTLAALFITTVIASPSFMGGVGGCGGSKTNNATNNQNQAGLTIFSVRSVPSFSGFLNPSILVENGPTPILKTQTSPGSFCSEFCYLKQGLIETARQLKTIDLSVCVAQAVNRSDSTFDIPTAGCTYYDLVTDDGDLPVRLCRDGNRVSIGTCSNGAMDEEYLFDNDTSQNSVSATLTRRYQNADGCEDNSRLSVSSNCAPEDFANGTCAVNIQGSFCGCYGNGIVNYGVTGGTAPNIDVNSNFSAGGIGADTFGTFDFCSIGNWSLGNSGCFKSDASGSFPSIPAGEVPLAQLEGCESIVAANQVCPNEAFDPNTFDPAYPVCPFKDAPTSSCSFAFNDSGCCDISGNTLEDESGTTIDPNTVSSLFNTVSAASCPGAVDCNGIVFDQTWDCNAPLGQNFTVIDATSGALNLTECLAILNEINNFQVSDNCDEQTADQETLYSQSVYEGLASCTSDKDCTAGEICHITDPVTPAGSCVTAPTVCSPQNGDADCTAGQVCAFDPTLGNARCVPESLCPSNCTSGTPCNVSTGACESVACTFSVPNDCVNKLGGSYTCTTGFAGPVCQ